MRPKGAGTAAARRSASAEAQRHLARAARGSRSSANARAQELLAELADALRERPVHFLEERVLPRFRHSGAPSKRGGRLGP